MARPVRKRSLQGGFNDALPFARGYGEVAAVLGTLVFIPFVLPALLLGLARRALGVAATLAAVGGLLYLLDPLSQRLSAGCDEHAGSEQCSTRHAAQEPLSTS